MDGMDFLSGERTLETGITINGADQFVRSAKLMQDSMKRMDDIISAFIASLDSALTRFDLMVTRLEALHDSTRLPMPSIPPEVWEALKEAEAQNDLLTSGACVRPRSIPFGSNYGCTKPSLEREADRCRTTPGS